MSSSLIFSNNYRLKPIDYGNYYYYQNVFTESEISKIHSLGEASPKEKGVVTDSGHVTETRISDVSWIDQKEESYWLYQKISELVNEANKSMWEFDIYGYHDSLQYTTYYGGGGHYDWHTDVGPMMANRKVSVVLQLTKPDEYEGGDLQLNGGNGIIEAPKDFNTMIIFPSFMLHRVTPVITGTRKSLVTWLAGPNLR
jgi:PKHD-type hydroxylase